VSIVSFWEIAIKSSLGKLDLPAPISQMMKDCDRLDFSILTIKSGHLEKLLALPWYHRDPFDRLLVCQAQAENLALVTQASHKDLTSKSLKSLMPTANLCQS
jgi:PIN domain nuclease of toxin-antitoxin system